MTTRPTERTALLMCLVAAIGIIGAAALTLHVLSLPICAG